MKTTTQWLKLYTFLGLSYLIAAQLGYTQSLVYLKPLLIPCLFFGVSKAAVFQGRQWLLLGLFFSWIGDCVLLGGSISELYFILGLVSFLIAHISYIVLFTQQVSDRSYYKKPIFGLGLLFLGLYLIGLLQFLYPSLGPLKIPVSVYAGTITLMLVLAWKGCFGWSGTGKYLVFAGALFFVTSDSLLALDKFHAPIPFGAFSIMSTYLLAQYGIVKGLLAIHTQKR
jgi:uncharacterized membrane protein YhhN